MLVDSVNHKSMIDKIMSDVFVKSNNAPSFNNLEIYHEQLIQQILADTQVSDSEKDLINQAKNYEGSNRGVFELIHQLIASCDDNHPYLYYYHFWNGIGMAMNDERDYTTEEIHAGLLEVVKEMDESIRLNSNFGEAYYVRGIAHGHLGNEEQGIEDILTAINLGCPDAIAFRDKLINQ